MIEASGGLSTTELSRMLDVDEQAVKKALFAAHGRFRSDRDTPPRWWLAGERPAMRDAPFRARPPGPNRPDLYIWQTDALRAWEEAGGRGVIEAVTGAGKTMVGIAATLAETDRRGQVLVLVPTVELQDQWVQQLRKFLPGSRPIGRLGAGGRDRLSSHDVVVAVINTARSYDSMPIRRGGLLVADECHRYGSEVNRLALDGRFSRRLGLSATYARSDSGNSKWLDPFFGGTCFRLGYARAVAEGVTAHFEVTLIGVEFSALEQRTYDELTDKIRALWMRLVEHFGVTPEPFELFMQEVAEMADGGGEGSATARAYRQAMLTRRRLLADTPAKDEALVVLAPAVRAADRAIVFTQSIDTAERTATVLAECGLRAGVIHSRLPGDQRATVLARFASGRLEVVVAPRLLDEGIDVPAADLAVIVGASRSRRQMIQRMGRVLRRKPDGRAARFAVLFVKGTVEDPRSGAHEAFLGEVTEVADSVTYFSPIDLRRRPDVVRSSLEHRRHAGCTPASPVTTGHSGWS